MVQNPKWCSIIDVLERSQIWLSKNSIYARANNQKLQPQSNRKPAPSYVNCAVQAELLQHLLSLLGLTEKSNTPQDKSKLIIIPFSRNMLNHAENVFNPTAQHSSYLLYVISNYSNYAGPCFFLCGIDILCRLFVMSQQLTMKQIQHLLSSTVTHPMSVRMVNNNMIILFLIICGLGKCKRTTQNLNNEKISITCFEKATKLVKTLFSDMKNLEKQYQRIDKSLRIMGNNHIYAFVG